MALKLNIFHNDGLNKKRQHAEKTLCPFLSDPLYVAPNETEPKALMP
jgi:hypothetical protein